MSEPCLRDRSFAQRCIERFEDPQKEGGARKIYGNVWISRYVRGLSNDDRRILRAAVAHALAPSASDSAYRLRHTFGLPWDAIPQTVVVEGSTTLVSLSEYAGIWRWQPR